MQVYLHLTTEVHAAVGIWPTPRHHARSCHFISPPAYCGVIQRLGSRSPSLNSMWYRRPGVRCPLGSLGKLVGYRASYGSRRDTFDHMRFIRPGFECSCQVWRVHATLHFQLRIQDGKLGKLTRVSAQVREYRCRGVPRSRQVSHFRSVLKPCSIRR